MIFLLVSSMAASLAEPPAIVLEETRSILVEDEVKCLEKLIDMNESRLQRQKTLKEKMVLFQQQREEFIQGNQSKKHAFALVSNAREILGEVKRENLSYLFPGEYLDELVFFSSIAGKSAPVRP